MMGKLSEEGVLSRMHGISLTAGFTFFPTFVALVHKKTYVECTKYVRWNTPATASSRQPQTTNKRIMAVR